MTTAPIVLSYGMGVDSTAILLRWLTDPSSRDFELDQLTVITAQTGDEFPETGALVEKHVLPLLAEAGVRTVQVARKTAAKGDGVSVLDDTTSPARCFIAGDYKLSTELRIAGTVPQVASGKRLCSQKAKGWPLDMWLTANIDGPFRHAVGFAVGEESRRDRDQTFATAGRIPEYPLIEWGWDRQTAIDFIASVTGAQWPKSCCTFCPFAKDNHAERYAENPEAGADAMLMELLSLTLNARSTLFASKSVIALNAGTPAGAEFDRRISVTNADDPIEWSCYEVKRAMHAKGAGARSVVPLATGSFFAALRALRAEAAAHGAEVYTDGHGITRADVVRRGDTFPATEHSLAVGPAGVHKVGPAFAASWAKYAS